MAEPFHRLRKPPPRLGTVKRQHMKAPEAKKRRRLLLDMHGQGMTYEQIAEAVNLSPSSVGEIIRKARADAERARTPKETRKS